ncbi:hypothetical protein J2I47_11050 [Fibrella sp. HMF5335]|uniref:TIGR03067 domain-containing protein n=1 Tax=Fibrella rubiginis TaxID=2817060 RepID=A0A939GII0_9BACT|nr:hypothetical protein [Fibrella rubiginis]MBO0937083.1 hypothetical protein [Fibrella rubiginis]
MQKARIFLFMLLLGMAVGGHTQANQRNKVFVGKWEISIADSPEIKFITNLVRKKGRLTGELTDTRNPAAPKLPITRVEEKGNSMSIFYTSAEKKELTIDLTKVDADNLKGTMYTFDASAKRIK